MATETPHATAAQRVRVWDGFTRLAHWLLVALVSFSWWSAKTQHMDYHRYSGYALLGVLLFRIYWGMFGSSTARFANFIKGPRAVWEYVRSPSAGELSTGHNPLGAWSVVVLLSLLIAQVSLGLFAVDVDGLESGPLSSLVSFDLGRVCARLHGVVFNVLLGFIGLHLLAVLFYWLVKRDNLIAPMLTGWKTWHLPSRARVEFAPWWLGFIGILIAAGVVWTLV